MFRTFIIITILISSVAVSAQDNCLFRNPLCFYNTDILTYLQALHKNQQFEKMVPFFYGSFSDNNKNNFVNKLGEVDFGYTLKRVGVKEIEKDKWSLTYQRTIMGTNKNFKIECVLVNDTCRVLIDQKQWDKLFK